MQRQLHQFKFGEYGFEFLAGQFAQNSVREPGALTHLAPLRNSISFAGMLARTGRKRNPSQRYHHSLFYRPWLAANVRLQTTSGSCVNGYASVQCSLDTNFLWAGKHPSPAGLRGQKQLTPSDSAST